MLQGLLSEDAAHGSPCDGHELCKGAVDQCAALSPRPAHLAAQGRPTSGRLVAGSSTEPPEPARAMVRTLGRTVFVAGAIVAGANVVRGLVHLVFNP
jgi:hypothetical protein